MWEQNQERFAKKSSTYLRGYASGFFDVSASFRQNSQNAHYGTIFHHPAGTFRNLATREKLSAKD